MAIALSEQKAQEQYKKLILLEISDNIEIQQCFLLLKKQKKPF